MTQTHKHTKHLDRRYAIFGEICHQNISCRPGGTKFLVDRILHICNRILGRILGWDSESNNGRCAALIVDVDSRPTKKSTCTNAQTHIRTFLLGQWQTERRKREPKNFQWHKRTNAPTHLVCRDTLLYVQDWYGGMKHLCGIKYSRAIFGDNVAKKSRNDQASNDLYCQSWWTQLFLWWLRASGSDKKHWAFFLIVSVYRIN